MEEDDPIVQEIPIYLSQALAEHLYLYQYPSRPGNREWKDVKVANASIKPKNHLVRVEVGLDTYSDKYCESKGEQIALNTDGYQESSRRSKDKDKTPYFRAGTMDKIVYESCEPSSEVKNFAIAVLQDKELHVTPLIRILQMRQAYSYFDKQDKRKLDKNKLDSDDDEEKEAEAKQVTVKFARQETEVAKKARENSYETISQRIAQEPWYDAMWKHCDTDHSDLERLKLFSSTSSEGSPLIMKSKEYVHHLVPLMISDQEEMQRVKKLTLQEQITELLIGAKLMTFNSLRASLLCESSLSEAALLGALSGAACCVRGLWAPRSTALYTRAAPVPPHLLCAARDHVLYLFTQHLYVMREKITAAVRLPPEDVLRVLCSVAKYSSRKNGWELLLSPDVTFETKYPDIVQRQNLYWEARQRQYNEMSIGECLYLFTQHSYVMREKIAAAVRLPPEDVIRVLSSVAKYSSRINGWELLLPPDVAFEAKYPDIVQRQNLYWEARQRQFNEMSIGECVPKRQRKKSQRESVSSDSLMSPKARCNSVSEEDSERKRGKNKGSTKRTRHASSSSVHDGM